ncbi:hypothetical protein [Mycoplasmopsis caviae]|uniref:Uncharacterized protein n=1 Tax=Mycoplasmopsis caviae TaxID=55603 RepID=A0A3P8LBL4_9BACT|nr:hypothetical protein [Mycoplasmopsis caviae]VDR42541.1 Uncharacterised protein [Mycoplasmopsis caviae]
MTTETSAKVNEIKKAINELNQQIGAFESLKHKINESIDNYEDVSNLYSGTLSKLKELNNKIESTEQAVINSVIDEVAKSFKIFTINGDLKTKIVNGVKEIMEKRSWQQFPKRIFSKNWNIMRYLCKWICKNV